MICNRICRHEELMITTPTVGVIVVDENRNTIGIITINTIIPMTIAIRTVVEVVTITVIMIENFTIIHIQRRIVFLLMKMTIDP